MKKHVYALMCALLVSGTLFSCSDDENGPGTPDPVNPTGEVKGFYILNGGDYGANNASISFFDEEGKLANSDIYSTANGTGLGDSGQQMILYGTKLYVTVTNSNRLVVLDLDGNLLQKIEPLEDGQPMHPRCMATHDGKVYISYYYGHAVAVMDTTSLSVSRVTEVGRYPEQLVVADGKLYVANSGGLDNGNYGTTLSVVDLETLEVEKEIEVLINPTEVTADSRNNIYVISMGNYGDIKNTLQRIDAETGEVDIIANATKMTLVNDELYTIYAQYGEPEMLFKKYDTQSFDPETKELDVVTFLSPAPDFVYPTLFAVHPSTGQIYIGDAVYGETGSLYIYSSAGAQIGEVIDTAGPSPASICFLD
ncbi:MAG: hypothetical protein LIP06_02615 [Tannerellaceae bacterium]|nr:hypothetical protein [Tannerellaceae bacterium]